MGEDLLGGMVAGVGREAMCFPLPFTFHSRELQEEAADALDFSASVSVRKQASALCSSLSPCGDLLDHHRTDTDSFSPPLVTWKSRHPGIRRLC